ncbi:MAG TPA: biotin/lipoyl-containing protein, partial [Terriglobales bacterium]
MATGERIAVLEAMKLEMQVSAPFSGVVRKVMAIPNVQVGSGAPLVQIDPLAGHEQDAMSPRMQFAALAAGCVTRPAQPLSGLRQMLLGFDVTAEFSSRSPWTKSAEHPSTGDEDDVLSIFLDICSLFRNTPRLGKDLPGESPSPEACLVSFLHSAGSDGQNLPAEFLDALRRAIRHYGIESLQRTPALDEALLRIYKSHQRIERQLPAVTHILQHRLDTLDLQRRPPDQEFRALLDRLVSVTRNSFPSVSELARELRYRCFELPLFEEIRNRILRTAEDCLDLIEAAPQSDAAVEKKLWLVECPQLLAALFSNRLPRAPLHLQQTMLEVLTLRYYCVRRLADFRAFAVNGFCAVATNYTEGEQRTHVIAIRVNADNISTALVLLQQGLSEFSSDEDICLDLLVTHEDGLDQRELREVVREQLVAVNLPRRVRRIVFALPVRDQAPGHDAMEYLTYEPTESGYEEVQLFRGVHPATGDRLHLWRLENFDIKRLPSIEDIFVLNAVAKTNRKDERLFAVAEVRDLTPVRDTSGRVTALPNLERMFTEAVAAI